MVSGSDEEGSDAERQEGGGKGDDEACTQGADAQPGLKPAARLDYLGLHGRAALPEQHHLLLVRSGRRCWRRRRLEVHKAGGEGEDQRHRQNRGTDAVYRSWQGLPCVALPTLDQAQVCSCRSWGKLW